MRRMIRDTCEHYYTLIVRSPCKHLRIPFQCITYDCSARERIGGTKKAREKKSHLNSKILGEFVFSGDGTNDY